MENKHLWTYALFKGNVIKPLSEIGDISTALDIFHVSSAYVFVYIKIAFLFQ